MRSRVFDGDGAQAAYHELGHVLAFKAFGYRVSSVEVGEDSGCTVLPEQTVNAFDLIVGLCAGKAAVDKWYGYPARDDENWRKSNEYCDAYQVALKVSQNNRQAASLLMQWAERVAGAIIEEHWPEFHEAARALVEHGKARVR